MTRNEIIEKTLKEIPSRLAQDEAPYGDDPDWEEIVIAALQERLPETDIKTCEDFRHLRVTCCEICHQLYQHYEMILIDVPGGAKDWVCDPVRSAIYSELLKQVEQR